MALAILSRNIEEIPPRSRTVEILFFLIVSEIKEERAAGAFDAFLGFGDVIDLEAEMVRSDKALGVVEAGSALAEIVQQRQIDHAVAEVDRCGKVELFLSDTLQLEDALIKLRGLLEVAHDDRKVA